jgi:hypothetical protein
MSQAVKPFFTLFKIMEWGLCFLLAIPSSAVAGCVNSDVSGQYVIGSRSAPPPTQINDLDIQFGRNCYGNSSHGNNLQIYSGQGQVEQVRSRTVILDSKGWQGTPLPNTADVNATVNQQLYLPVLP